MTFQELINPYMLVAPLNRPNNFDGISLTKFICWGDVDQKSANNSPSKYFVKSCFIHSESFLKEQIQKKKILDSLLAEYLS